MRERLVCDQDKFIDILTKSNGLLEIFVKGACKINGKISASTQIFAYSRFCYEERKNMLYVNNAEPIHIFYDLRHSLSSFSLSSYFAEIIKYSATEFADSENILRLLLNTLYYLEKGMRSESQLKSIFELRYISEIGYMPYVICCCECGCYEPEELYFFFKKGEFCCINCLSSDVDNECFKMKLPVLLAIRHIIFTDFKRLYNFHVSNETLKQLSIFSENYLRLHLEKNFRTLDFYRLL